MLIPGIVSVTFRDKTVDEILQASSSCGLKAIEWSENAHVLPDDEEGAKQLHAKTIAAGLQIAAYGSYFRLLASEQPEDVFKKSLLSAKALQAPVIRIWAGGVASSEATSEYRSRIAAEARLIADLAAKEGIKVALEWHRGTLTDQNESGLQLLDEVDHPNLYCLWQPTIELSMKERCEGLRELVARNKLLHIHAYYWQGEMRRPFAEGAEEWRQYFAQLGIQDVRYVLIEFVKDNTIEQLSRDAAALKRCIDKLYEI